jgi:hypothetical protein
MDVYHELSPRSAAAIVAELAVAGGVRSGRAGGPVASPARLRVSPGGLAPVRDENLFGIEAVGIESRASSTRPEPRHHAASSMP